MTSLHFCFVLGFFAFTFAQVLFETCSKRQHKPASDQINNRTGNITTHIALNSKTLPLRSGVCLKTHLWMYRKRVPSTPTLFISVK